MSNTKIALGIWTCIMLFVLGWYLISIGSQKKNARNMIAFRLKHHELLMEGLLDIQQEISERVEELGQRLSKLEEKRNIDVRAR